MAKEFNNYAAKGNEVLQHLAKELKVPNDKAFRILNATLHALRDHLPVNESVHILSQLPMALKGVYVDQWDANRRAPRIHHVSEFLDEVRGKDKILAGFDLGNDEQARKSVGTVFGVLRQYIAPGEFHDLLVTLPLEVREFILEHIQKKEKI